jgi:extracellular factor (EF) 3-hydroxypalmitic acid methyl ester biosynthesis protein
MASGLDLLQYLEDDELDWLFNGFRQFTLQPGDVLVAEGEPSTSMFFILQGLFVVSLSHLGEEPIAKLGSGEVVGEIGFLDRKDRTATVKATEVSLVIDIPFSALEQRIQEQERFAAHWFRALSEILAGRLRTSLKPTHQRGRVREQSMAMESLERSLEKLKQTLGALGDESARVRKAPSKSTTQAAQAAFAQLTQDMDAYLNETSPVPADVRLALGAHIAEEVLPFVLLGRLSRRLHEKPRGVACDYEALRLIHANEPEGVGAVGALLDRCFLDLPACKALRNRRQVLGEEILKTLDEQTAEVRVASLGCGPGEELFDVFAQLESPQRLRVHAVDYDPRSLVDISQRSAALGLKSRIELHHLNLLDLALGRVNWDVEGLQLVYTVGLIDTFEDRIVLKMLNFIHSILAVGGRLVLAVIHPNNASRPVMDHLVDWKLIHRSEAEIDVLLKASKFGRPCDEIRFENEGVIFFGSVRKA